MKNQVNKKVSKILIALLSLVIMSVSCVLLAACNKECTHSKITDGEDTATCVSGGFITHTCDDCGYTYMTATPAKPHTYDTAEKVAATCTEKGYTVATCTLCGYELKTDFVDALGHAETETIVTAATCTKDGNEIVKCKDCGIVLSVKTLAATGHNYLVKTTVAATCGADGYIVNECSVCGDQVTVKGDPATGAHTFVTTSESPATCTEMGLKVERCEVCGLEHSEVLPKIEHTYTVKSVAATCEVKAHKEKVCDVCGDAVAYDYVGELAEHDYKTIAETFATCVTAGKKVEVCKVCGDEKVTETPATGEHTYGSAGAAVEATCTTEGYVPYTCTVCKTVLKKNVKPALGHEFDVANGATVVKAVAATCTTEGYNIVKCARCDVQSTVATDEALGHDYVVEKVVAATCLAEGYTLEICSRCDLSKKTDIVAATGHNYEVSFTKTATCTTDGEKLYDCTNCGAQKKEVLAAAGHVWGNPTVIDATCTEPEYQYNTCTVCGTTSELQETAPALNPAGHTFTTEVLVAANCYQTGKAINTCEVCGYSEEVVLGVTEHTYHIADAVMNNTVETELRVNYPTLYAKYTEKGADYYCTVSAVSCTAAGTVVAKCDYCEARYNAATEAALGHNFETATYAATCYNEGYTVLECTRCHYEAGERTAVVPALAHVMTVVSSDDGTTLVLYATKNAAGELTIYTDSACSIELPATDFCNVFYKDADAHYVFFCDTCHADVGENYITAASREETSYIYTDYMGNKFTVYATSMSTVTDTAKTSAEHVYSLVADTVDSDPLVCEQERKEIYYCTNCKADYRKYNKTALELNSETSKYENNEGHYCDVNYIWYYHELPGVPTEEGYGFDINGDGVIAADEKINTMVGAACTEDATYSYGCRVCGATLVVANKVDKETIGSTNIETVYNAYLEGLTEEERAAEEDKAYVSLTDAMMSSSALGHDFTIANGATYVVKAYDAATGTFTNRTCDANEVLVIAIKCLRCDVLNFTADPATYDVAAAAKYTNVPHGAIDTTALAAGEFAWSNVVYYAYGEDGHWVENATAETAGAVATVLNPDESGNKCDAFTCVICSEVVAQHHYANITDATVDCRNAQLCYYCGIELKAKTHIRPAYTCYSIKGDGYYYCAVCGADDDGVALGAVTPHNVTVALVTDSTCTATGTWSVTCGCGTEIGAESKVIGIKGATTGAAADLYGAYTAAIDAATTSDGVTTIDTAWFTIPMKAHTPGEWEITEAATCTTDGTKVKKCTVCETVLETETIPAPGHTAPADWTVTVEATCTTTGTKVKNCTVCGANLETETIAALGHTLKVDSVVVDHTEPTCTTEGVTTYKCGRCGEALPDYTEVEHKLYHNITLTVKADGKVNCVYGAELEAFSCSQCDDVDYSNYLAAGVLYQAKAAEYLATLGDIDPIVWATWTTAGGALSYTAGEHYYTKFDTNTSHGDLGFVKPTADTKGSAYWTCSVPECQDRTYITGSVTLEHYYNPDVNMNWATTAALEDAMDNVTMTINGTANETLTRVTATYFDVTAAGFVIKADKVEEVAAAIYDALVADVTGTEIVVAGTTCAWSTADESAVAATKAAIAAALQNAKLAGVALNIAITF